MAFDWRSLYLTVSIIPGVGTISQACDDACALATLLASNTPTPTPALQPVRLCFAFNGTPCEIRPDDTPATVESRYWRDRKHVANGIYSAAGEGA